MTKDELKNYEIGKEYFFKTKFRLKRIRGILTSKDSHYTGLSLYHGCETLEFKTKRGTKFSLVLYGIEKIESIGN